MWVRIPLSVLIHFGHKWVKNMTYGQNEKWPYRSTEGFQFTKLKIKVRLEKKDILKITKIKPLNWGSSPYRVTHGK